jgi:hypothetical protein
MRAEIGSVELDDLAATAAVLGTANTYRKQIRFTRRMRNV